uniref:Nitroreductase domain-containing protein n=1 Tax=Araucaria cunninghamii TaxID=56994 RepID=A0A0D6QVA1_ARACU
MAATISAASSSTPRYCVLLRKTTSRFKRLLLARKTATMASSSAQPQTSTLSENLSTVLNYHEETKHSFRKYARGPHGLDWANQPNPFRRYETAPVVPLLHLPPDKTTDDPPYPDPFLQFPAAKPLDKSAVSQLFYDSLALSAWKTTGYSTWSLRVNPSSGNLHPTEGYIVCGPVSGISETAFVAHYAPKEHALEIRAEIPLQLWSELRRGFPENTFFVGLTTIFWREAWKYGERAFRYCNHDVGHAIGAVSIAAAVLGWDTRLIDGLSHRQLEVLLGLAAQKEFVIPDRPVKGFMPELEREHADCLMAVFPAKISGGSSFDLKIDYGFLSSVISRLEDVHFKGRPNALSKEHVCWDIIYRTANATQKPVTDIESPICVTPLPKTRIFSEAAYKGFGVREVVRKRRSAVDMDGMFSIGRETFYQILSKTIPSGWEAESQGEEKQVPFRTLPWRAELHMVLYVHRVVGLQKGIYFLVRNSDHFDALRRAMRSEFEWDKPAGCPPGLSLYRLAAGDCCELAKRLSCHQDIAGDGCFSLGMLAHFEPTLRERHAWMYPRLFWESGLLGQILYLEAHAVGISATGIGCYFDDPVHDSLGLSGKEFQSLYHFTIGTGILDKRIMNLPAYPGPAVDA